MSSRQQTVEKIALKFNIPSLDAIIISLINNPMNKKFASNVRRLFGQLDPSSFRNDQERDIRVFIIKKLASEILDKRIENKNTLLNFLNLEGVYEVDATEIINNLFQQQLSEVESAAIDRQVASQLRYGLIGNKVEDVMDLLTSFQTENYTDFDEFISDFCSQVDGFNKDLLSARECFEDPKNEISLGDDNFVSLLDNIIKTEANPSSRIKSGIKAFNEMLNGGFEQGRVYMALGLPKGWKSGFLLNSCIWALRYNNLKAKKPGLKPVVVYLTMENTIVETVKRIWSHCFGNDSKMSDYTSAEAARLLQEAKIFTPNAPDRAELMIVHRATKSINTQDMNDILDDLEKNGRECVFLVQDYVKRIRSTVNHKEERIELSLISDEFATIAKKREIPILTAMQLNREAFRAFENAESGESQINAVEKLGASYVGESINLIQNVDFAFIVGRTAIPRLNDAGDVEMIDRFLVVKLVSTRDKSPKVMSFKHRFVAGNDMALTEDFNLQTSLSLATMEDVIKEKIASNGTKTRGARRIIG